MHVVFPVCLTLILSRVTVCRATFNELSPRKKCGAEVLSVLSGQRLLNSTREKALEEVIIRIPAPSPPEEWDALCVDVCARGETAIATSLSSSKFWVPDVDKASESKCSLSLCPVARDFLDETINQFIINLFQTVSEAEIPGVSKVALNRFDLFHAHLFIDYTAFDLGIIFHAREYPAFNHCNFPYVLGYCQKGSTLVCDPVEMAFRNFIWYKGNLAALDTSAGNILYDELLFPGTRIFHTVFEDELGIPAADLFFFESLCATDLGDMLFVCERFSDPSIGQRVIS